MGFKTLLSRYFGTNFQLKIFRKLWFSRTFTNKLFIRWHVLKYKLHLILCLLLQSVAKFVNCYLYVWNTLKKQQLLAIGLLSKYWRLILREFPVKLNKLHQQFETVLSPIWSNYANVFLFCEKGRSKANWQYNCSDCFHSQMIT